MGGPAPTLLICNENQFKTGTCIVHSYTGCLKKKKKNASGNSAISIGDKKRWSDF